MDQSSMNLEMGGHGKTCKCMHHKLVPFFIFLIGLVALLGNFSLLSSTAVGIAWPVLLMLIGLQKMCDGMCRCCSK